MIYFLTGWKRWLPCVLGLGLVFFMAPIDAQEQWPSHPVKLVVSSSAGGGTDMYARLLSQALGETFKQQFIVDNRPGASGNIGAAYVAHAPADGYTFLVSANTALTINGSLYKNLSYDADKDFVPIARVLGPLVLVVPQVLSSACLS